MLLPFYVEPLVIGNGLLVTALGIPVYLVGVYWQKKPPIFHKIMGKLLFEIYLDWDYFHSNMIISFPGFLNVNTQKMFMAVKEE